MLDSVVQNWAQNDPAAAGQWLNQLPDDAAKQGAVNSYINDLAYQSPDLAAPWVNALSDPNQRNSAIQNVARNWLRTDPTTATRWLNTTALPEDQKQQLLKNPDSDESGPQTGTIINPATGLPIVPPPAQM